VPRRIFAAGSVTNATGAPLRLEFYPTSTSTRREADLWTIDGSNNLVERIPNGVVLTDTAGAYSAFAGPDDLDTLYVLPSNTTSRTTLTGSSSNVPGAAASTWATPTASTTLTGTLAAWVVTAVDCTAGAGARTLPAASSVPSGTAVSVKKADTSTNSLVVSRAGSDLIYGTGSGSTTKTLTLAGEAVEFVSNGVDKWTVRSSDTPSGVLATTYARNANTKPALGRRIVFFGDSIVNGSGASNFVYAFPQQTINMLGTARFDFIEAGTSGYTSTQLAAHVPTVLAAYSDIGLAVILIGTNDVGGAVSLATYQANLATIVSALQAKGIPFVFCTVPPRATASATLATRQTTLAYNTWLRLWGAAQGGALADVFGALVDTTTGDLLTANSADGIHPTDIGHWRIACTIVAAIKAAGWSTSSLSPLSLVTGISLITNPVMAGTPGAGKPTGWIEQPGGTGTAPTYSIIADTTGILPAGQWMEMDFDATASGGVRQMVAAAALGGVAGDVLAATYTILLEDVSGTWPAHAVQSSNTADCSPRLADQGFATKRTWYQNCPGIPIGNALATGNTVYQLGPVIQTYTIPAAVTSWSQVIRVKAATGDHFKVRLGSAHLFNLTTLGLQSLVLSDNSTAVSLNGP
jgi:lysophospholipase L1-like esterase